MQNGVIKFPKSGGGIERVNASLLQSGIQYGSGVVILKTNLTTRLDEVPANTLAGTQIFFDTGEKKWKGIKQIDEKYRGFYANETELNNNVTSPQAGDYADVASTSTIWYWNTAITPNAWSDTFGNVPPVYYTQAEIDSKFQLKPITATENNIATFDDEKNAVDGGKKFKDTLTGSELNTEKLTIILNQRQTEDIVDVKISEKQSGIRFIASWNPKTNTPTLPSTPDNATYNAGDYYIVSGLDAGEEIIIFGFNFTNNDRLVTEIDDIASNTLKWGQTNFGKKANEIFYDSSTDTLVASNVQDAISELDYSLKAENRLDLTLGATQTIRVILASELAKGSNNVIVVNNSNIQNIIQFPTSSNTFQNTRITVLNTKTSSDVLLRYGTDDSTLKILRADTGVVIFQNIIYTNKVDNANVEFYYQDN